MLARLPSGGRSRVDILGYKADSQPRPSEPRRRPRGGVTMAGLFVTIWTTIACLVFTAVGVAALYQFIASVASPTVAKTCLVVVTLPVIFVCRWIFRRLRRL